jgi:peptidoglycan/xylan/chitin deacetylase (PgdA/CDA1 family)
VLALAASGCIQDLAEMDNVFYDGDGRKVHCAVNLDDAANNSLASIDSGLDRAAARGEIIELYAHAPGKTVSLDRLEHTLAGAALRGLRFVLYSEIARGEARGPGIALSLDDASVQLWTDTRPLFDRYGAKVTFFVSRYHRLGPELRDQLRALAMDGHEIAAHSVNHVRAPEFVEDHGLARYLAEEVVPSIEILRDEGYEVSAFAYPYGARTSETDRAILEHVPILRAVSFSWGAPIQDGCPR